MIEENKKPLYLGAMARRLRVPATWLRAEAEASGQYPLPPEQREWVDAPAVGHEVLTPYDPAEFLTSAEAVAAFLADAEATADPAYIQHACEVAARARAMHGLDG